MYVAVVVMLKQIWGRVSKYVIVIFKPGKKHHHRSLLTVVSATSHFRFNLFIISETFATVVVFSGPNRWKSLGDKSRQYGGCSRSCHCSFLILSWVARAVWGLTLSWWSSVHLASLPGRFCELHHKASTELHSMMQNSHFHHASENGITIIPENPKTR
jgi:hypothetical protein